MRKIKYYIKSIIIIKNKSNALFLYLFFKYLSIKQLK